MSRLAPFFLFAALAMADSAPVADEALRIAALRAVFPGMRIELAPGRRIDLSWPEKPRPAELDAPDALAGENIYRVIGGATNEAERQASDQLITHKASNTRLIRFQIFHWPGSSGLVAILQYNFENAVPPMACPSVGLLVHLENADGKWEVRERYLLEPMNHSSLKTVRMLNLTGDGADQLVIESDFGGADTWGTNFLVFNLGAKLELAFETTSQVVYKLSDMFTEDLDVPETVQRHGEEFCFTKTTMFENGILFDPVRLTKNCYKPDEEMDRKGSEDRDKLLTPLKKSP